MKFTITMKDPDGFHNCLDEAVDEAVGKIEGIDDDEREALKETKREKLKELLGKWFEYSEYLMVEIDTEEQSIRVVPN